MLSKATEKHDKNATSIAIFKSKINVVLNLEQGSLSLSTTVADRLYVDWDRPTSWILLSSTCSSTCIIRRRSDYIIGFVTPAIGPNKFKKLTRLIAPVHNIRGKV